MELPSVVVSGHLMALGVVRSLGRRGVRSVVVSYRDAVDMAPASRHVRHSVRVPHPERDEEGFIAALMRLGPRLEGSPLLPASDESLSVIAHHRDELARWFRVASPDAGIVDAIIEKEHTYALADAIGLPAPRTFLPASEDELERMATELGYPCLIKPSQSHRYVELFKRKMVRADDRSTLLAAYREAREAGLDVLLQELIPGDDGQGVNYNSYRVDGRVVAEFTAQKVRLTPRNFGPPSVVISRRLPEVIELGRRLLDALGYEGYSCVEFKRDARDGGYRLMEVNGRFNLSSLLSERCGMNFPWIVYRHLVTGEVETVDDFREGVYWIDGTKDLAYGLPELVRRPWMIGRFLAPYRAEKVFAVLDGDDLRPIAKRYALLGADALRGIGHRVRGG